jgi:soluble lytic murein transglycosylase
MRIQSAHKAILKRTFTILVLVSLFLVSVVCAYLYWRITRFDGLIKNAAEKYSLDFNLVKSLIYEESWFDPDARGEDGEIGLMQVTVGVEREYTLGRARGGKAHIKLFEPSDNLEVGCWYLRQSLDRFKSFVDPVPLALARYNAGESRVRTWIRLAQNGKENEYDLDEKLFLKTIDIPSTRDYLMRILRRYRQHGSYAKQGSNIHGGLGQANNLALPTIIERHLVQYVLCCAYRIARFEDRTADDQIIRASL